MNLDVHGTLHIKTLIPSETGHQSYSVVFEAYGSHSEKKALIFESIHELGRFLRREVGVSDEAFERVIADLRDPSGAKIYDVVLSNQELNRLGF